MRSFWTSILLLLLWSCVFSAANDDVDRLSAADILKNHDKVLQVLLVFSVLMTFCLSFSPSFHSRPLRTLLALFLLTLRHGKWFR